jgi:hypothetical protein
LARFIFSHQPAWIGGLVTVRDALVAGLGLKTARQLESLGAMNEGSRVGFFKIYSTTPTEIVLGEDDTHLDFRLSVLCSRQQSPTGTGQLTLSTVVHCHNSFGPAAAPSWGSRRLGPPSVLVSVALQALQ